MRGARRVAWAQRNGREDVLVGLASIPISHQALGLPSDPGSVNEELAINAGYGVREFLLESASVVEGRGPPRSPFYSETRIPTP